MVSPLTADAPDPIASIRSNSVIYQQALAFDRNVRNTATHNYYAQVDRSPKRSIATTKLVNVPTSAVPDHRQQATPVANIGMKEVMKTGYHKRRNDKSRVRVSVSSLRTISETFLASCEDGYNWSD